MQLKIKKSNLPNKLFASLPNLVSNWITVNWKLRLQLSAPKEECLDECKLIDYTAKISTTKLPQTTLDFKPTLFHDPNDTNYVLFTVYYRTFDYTRIAYHGKVG